MRNDLTRIAFVLDCSGSMQIIKNDTIGSFNNFIEEQKKNNGECIVSITTFNHQRIYYPPKNLKEIELLKKRSFMPLGRTALLDAIGETINNVGNELKNIEEKERPSNVIIVVITDGEENSSKEFSKNIIKNMITHQESKYNWKFLYLGANQDSFTVGGFLGFNSSNIVNYDFSGKGTRLAYRSISNYVSNIRSGNDDVSLKI